MAAFETACQNRRLVRSGYLLPREHFSGGAIYRINRNHIGRSQIGDGPRQVGLHAEALTQLLRQLRRNSLRARLAQILQVAVQFRIAHQLQQRGLLELNGQRFLQRGIEDRVAGLIGEVGKNELIFVGELHGLMLAPVESAGKYRQQENNGAGNHEPSPEWPRSSSARGLLATAPEEAEATTRADPLVLCAGADVASTGAALPL